MAEWLFETGIGEDRAALVDDERIVEAIIETPGVRAGSVVEARLTAIMTPGARGVVTLSEGGEALVEPLPRHWTEGLAVTVEIVREAIGEAGKPKRARARPSDAPPAPGPDLRARIGAAAAILGPHDADRLEAAGWSELLESAATGEVPFPGGALRIAPTPAMTLIDVDGSLNPEALAIAGAEAAARAIRAFGIAGSIGIDLPTVAGKDARRAAAAAFDGALPPPFERTAVNGFGFMQVIRPRLRPSLIEQLRAEPAAAAARALLRRAERSGLIGGTRLIAPPPVIAILEQRPDWLTALAGRLGGAVALQADPALAMSAGHVARN